MRIMAAFLVLAAGMMGVAQAQIGAPGNPIGNSTGIGTGVGPGTGPGSTAPSYPNYTTVPPPPPAIPLGGYSTLGTPLPNSSPGTMRGPAPSAAPSRYLQPRDPNDGTKPRPVKPPLTADQVKRQAAPRNDAP
jgi:hypothetical protein